MAGLSKAAKEFISSAISEQEDEDRPQKQKVAIAFSKARKKGFKVARNNPSSHNLTGMPLKMSEKDLKRGYSRG